VGDLRVRPSEWVLAVVTTEPSRVAGGGAPVFVASSPQELERMARDLCRMTQASAHEVAPGTLVIMRH